MAKLLLVIVHAQDAGRLAAAFREGGYRATRLRSSGGFLGAENATLLLGLEDVQVEPAVELIQRTCRPRTEQVPIELLGGMEASWLPTEVAHGGATVFVLPIEQIRRA